VTSEGSAGNVNLLSNSAKFTPDGGAITIEARKEEKELEISVSDTGIGMTPQEQKKLFEAILPGECGIKVRRRDRTWL